MRLHPTLPVPHGSLALDPLVRPFERWGAPGSAGDADITVVIASIPPRARLLAKALESVCEQTLQPRAVVVEIDHWRSGAPATKNRAIDRADTAWVAPLDDDDLFLPYHLEALFDAARDSGADVVYSVPHIPQIPPTFRDPDGRYGKPFDAEVLRRRSYIQTTSLIRRESFVAVGGFQVPGPALDAPDDDPRRNYDDWGGWLRLLEAGGTFHHLPECTFVWNHHGFGTPRQPGNTSGRADRWSLDGERP